MRLTCSNESRRRSALLERVHTARRTSIRELAEGPATLRGYIRAVVPTVNDVGLFCVACETAPGVASAPGSSGGIFELVDRDGLAVWVDARHVAVLDGSVFDGECSIPPGVVVNVCGTVARVPAWDDEDARRYRDANTAWIMHGTARVPVIVQSIGA